MACKYTWYNLPNTIKSTLLLDEEVYDCIDNISEFNNLVSKAIWFDLPGRLNKMCVILELPIVVTWYNLPNVVKEICEYIENLECAE